MSHPDFVTLAADVPLTDSPTALLAGQVITTGADANSLLNVTAFDVGTPTFGVMSTLPVSI